jgi:hypothetical protein
MAYTKLFVRHANLKALLDYVMNEEKTVLREGLEERIDYATDEEKTRRGEIRFVSGINCFPETAAEQMLATKERWNKTGGRQIYHLIQSFSPDDNITPELAHELGRKYAETLLPGYEVIVSTHLDKEHIHNHICFNSVCMETGAKFHLTKPEFYEKIRGVSDNLCRENGLSVIEFEYGEKMTYKEWMMRRFGGNSWKEIIKRDVNSILSQARSMTAFMSGLEELGYEIDTSGMYAKVRPFEKERFVRLNTLGFSDETVERQISINRGQPVSARMKQTRVYYRKGGTRHPHRQLTRFEAQYLRYMYLLGKIRKYPQRSAIERSEMRRFNEYKAQFKYLAESRIDNAQTLAAREKNLFIREKELAQEKFKLKGAKKKLAPFFDAQITYQRHKEVVEIYRNQDIEYEAVARWDQARDTLQKGGYDTPEKIKSLAERRAGLHVRIRRNQQELAEVRKELKMVREIRKSDEHIKTNIEKQEVKEKWKEKQFESRSQVERF